MPIESHRRIIAEQIAPASMRADAFGYSDRLFLIRNVAEM